MNGEAFKYALKLLAVRDLSVAEVEARLEKKFGDVDPLVIEDLKKRKFLDDRRAAQNFIMKKPKHSAEYLRQRLLERGIDESIVNAEVGSEERPSLAEVVNVTMTSWKLHAPLHPRDLARLFRALSRLGYEEDAIREELEQFHEQQ